MVCRRSLYCLKYGPCATDEARRQIWEDNIKFREHFRAANQSDHYWSFQVIGQTCSCCDAARKPYLTRPKYGSLQALDQIDCSSVAHDRGTCVPPTPCPFHPSKKLSNSPERRDVATETFTKASVDKSVGLTPVKPRPHVTLASDFDLPSRYVGTDMERPCPRYKNSFSDSKKERYSSQPNLGDIGKQCSNDSEQQPISFPRRKPPISRTTRQSLLPSKTAPFLPFGWNNTGKQTHNVRAGGDIYPNAVNAKQQRQQNIKKLLHNEEQLHQAQQNNFKKKVVNHSSLWTTEYNRSYRDIGCDNVNKGIQRVSTPMPRPAMQPVRALRRPSSQISFY